ncbi:MAG: GGDEF domain-containing protein [Mycobacterium sp.]|nr:GGDEF domain-containing protein [Mycobacterium sp.]
MAALTDENKFLNRRLDRERRIRREAEEIAEQGLHDLYQKKRELEFLSQIATLANQAGSVREVLASALEYICQFFQWPVAHAYIVAADGTALRMRPGNIWYADPSLDLSALRTATAEYAFSKGEGLVGQVWESGRPVWLNDLSHRPTCPRCDIALRSGMRAAFAVPLLIGTQVAAALEFFGTTPLPMDPNLLDVLARAGTQLGRVIERDQRAVVQGMLDSMPSQCVLIDGSGAIIATNREWDRQWELARTDQAPDWRSMNYLELCRSGAASTMPNPFAVTAVDAVEELLAGHEESIVVEYRAGDPTPGSGKPRTFRLVALPLRGAQGAVLTHVDLAKLDDPSERDSGSGTGDVSTRDELIDRIGATLNGRAGDSGVALIVVGIDSFSDVVDAFGHAEGDRLVKTIGRRLVEHVGLDSLTARLGGAEFVVLMTGLPGQWDVAEFLKPIRRALTQPIQLELTAVHASVSFGVVRGSAPDADASDMLREADSAMRAARRQRRGGWAESKPTHRAEAQARVDAERLLVQALDNDSFELAYQPIVDLEAGRTAGAEALLRIRDTNGELVPPVAFLSALDTGPYIEQVGEWVLNTALEVQARWQTQPGMERHRMSINVSARQLGEGRFRAAVQRALARHGVPPHNLTVEILEEAIVRAGDSAESELRELAEMGVGVAIDDFGTGYSAMSYLLYFPVTSVKIDRSFMLASNTPRGLRLLRAAGEVARAVGASSVVEGVETTIHQIAAQTAAIEYGQGYLFGRPIPAGAQPITVRLDGLSLGVSEG